MVTKKTPAKNPSAKPATKAATKRTTKPKDSAKPSLAKQLEETQDKFEMAVVGLHMAKASMQLMSKKYDELFEAYEKAIKHIRKLEKAK
jgi:hypothetical protein